MEPFLGPSGATLCPLVFADLVGFAEDDLSAAFETFRRTAEAHLAGTPPLRPGVPVDAKLTDLFRRVASLRAELGQAEACAFFSTHFVPCEIRPAPDSRDERANFLTGYYEPEVAGSPTETAEFAAPILARPDDLVTLNEGTPRPDGFDPGLAAARRRADGALEPYPMRSEIERGAITRHTKPVVWLRDLVEVFLIQVQGSARVRLPDGDLLRLTYAGRNGQPYTSIGRLIVEEHGVPLAEMSLARLKSWLRDHGLNEGDEGRNVMQRNRSYVFFRGGSAADPAQGPIGAAGVWLTPLRSIAVDRRTWPYGLPFWIESEMPWQGEYATGFRRLMIAQDTGSAILGAARADVFFGTGDEAGVRAGGIRHSGRFVVFLPKGSVP
ncbi:murein transglycosylase A [Methylovirgula sp. 4M-Z18]|uniref:murein transglycosylase A n=1 Tax=Methylovirgula sp. 4M-Z18 TaxID=2293567 RepID=UPI000E2E5162|nr:MltA domain-containing protein [Methylovirgula sp. 4M-Z18]RFB78053.1 transglycosylase [Methylovirgula sp. 4M-Z18]